MFISSGCYKQSYYWVSIHRYRFQHVGIYGMVIVINLMFYSCFPFPHL